MPETYAVYITINFLHREEDVALEPASLPAVLDQLQTIVEAKPQATSFLITLVPR